MQQELVWLQNGHLRAAVNPNDGMNVYGLWYKGRQLVRVDEQRFARGANYGVPILYPSPNKVVGGHYQLGEGLFAAGMPHGLVRHEAFRVQSCKKAGITAQLQFDEDFAHFSAFPFAHVLEIRITLEPQRIRWQYGIQNKSPKPLPYGFALHPFFYYGGEEVRLCANTPLHLPQNGKVGPTGSLHSTQGTPRDITFSRPVRQLELDDAYLARNGLPAAAQLSWPKFSILLQGSRQFRFLVVFTPKGQEYFCIENQTCAPNAHNLHFGGHADVAGLQWVQPGETAEGYVEFCFMET